MAAVGAAEVTTWFLSSGVISFFILLLLLSIFLTGLCSQCGRRSFELRDPEAEKHPSALIKVVKLEEVARENPLFDDIWNDEKGNSVPFTPWRSHLGAPQHQDGSAAEVKTGSDPDATQNVNSSTSPDSAHIYQTIGGGSSDMSLQPANHEPRDEGGAADPSDCGRISIYTQVSKKVRLITPSDFTPELQVEEEKEEEDEASPPLPDRKTALKDEDDDDDDEGLKDGS